MHEVSIAWMDANAPMVKPTREKLGDHLCAFYAMRTNNGSSGVNSNKVFTSYFPHIIRKIANICSRWHIIPQYYGYILQHYALDMVFSNRVAKDDSSIVYVHCSFRKTIKKAKAKGKIVVTMAGNSEPIREYECISKEYQLFNIEDRYIYGDWKYQNLIKEGLSLADRIITISNVSRNTYVDANYSQDSFKYIPLTGTDFPVQSETSYKGKPKAFITTAFHNFIKGTHRLLLAWEKAGIVDVPLIVVGRLCEDMLEFVEKHGPFKNVIFKGYVPGSLSDFYNQYDAVGVLMSFSEGAVRTTPELMSFGFPMIVSPDATCDIVRDAYNGFVINPTDEEVLVERLLYFASDWNRVHSLRRNVLESVAHRTVKDFSEEVADYLISLI